MLKSVGLRSEHFSNKFKKISCEITVFKDSQIRGKEISSDGQVALL